MARLKAQVRFSPGLDRAAVDRNRNVRLRLRRAIGKWLADYIRDRVQTQGKGAFGEIEGYSRNACVIPWPPAAGEKPYLQPKGGTPLKLKGRSGQYMLFKGGYEEYKRKTGQVANRFTLTNTGALWRDWRYFESNSLTGPVECGFTDPKNTAVAEAIRTGQFRIWNGKVVDKTPRLGVFALDPAGRKKLRNFVEVWLSSNL